jgi:hypothetical protein
LDVRWRGLSVIERARSDGVRLRSASSGVRSVVDVRWRGLSVIERARSVAVQLRLSVAERALSVAG